MSSAALVQNSFDQFTSAQDLEVYLDGKEYKHGSYCHYTSLPVLENILKNKELWLGCVSDFNDCKDSDQFITDKRLYYSSCFSTGDNENLALWYLYSGLDGKGVRVRFTKAGIRKLIEYSTYSLCERASSKSIKCMDLVEGKTMKTKFKDILYYRLKNSTVDLKYNTKVNHKMPRFEFENYLENHIGFCKGLIWYYEKETRLLVELCGEAADYVKKNPDKKFIVTLGFDDNLYKRLRVDFAPEVLDIMEEIKDSPAVMEYVLKTSKAQLSCHSGTLSMDLCKKCSKKTEIPRKTLGDTTLVMESLQEIEKTLLVMKKRLRESMSENIGEKV